MSHVLTKSVSVIDLEWHAALFATAPSCIQQTENPLNKNTPADNDEEKNEDSDDE